MAARLDRCIVLDQVGKSFGPHVAVECLDLSVAEGEVVAILGRTGAGKSTVLNLIMGNMRPSSGTVRVAGLDPHRDFQALRGRIAVGFQTDRLLPWRTALENVAFGLQILRRPRAECLQTAQAWLDRVGLREAAGKYPHEMSGGMRQRVSLARALAVDPVILLLDECFSQLDHVTSRTLRREVSLLLRELGKTCLVVTHRIDDAIDMAERVLVLGAPARVVLQARVTDAERNDPTAAEALHDRIAAAMGGDAAEETEERSDFHA